VRDDVAKVVHSVDRQGTRQKRGVKEGWRMPRRLKTTSVDLKIEQLDPRMMICVLRAAACKVVVVGKRG
jgi:hypothetical protein